MQVEFYEEEVTGKVATATKVHIKKTIQGMVKVVQPEEVVVRIATAQDKVEFKTEFEAFLASRGEESEHPTFRLHDPAGTTEDDTKLNPKTK